MSLNWSIEELKMAVITQTTQRLHSCCSYIYKQVSLYINILGPDNLSTQDTQRWKMRCLFVWQNNKQGRIWFSAWEHFSLEVKLWFHLFKIVVDIFISLTHHHVSGGRKIKHLFIVGWNIKARCLLNVCVHLDILRVCVVLLGRAGRERGREIKLYDCHVEHTRHSMCF